jgi:hypothetical protein
MNGITLDISDPEATHRCASNDEMHSTSIFRDGRSTSAEIAPSSARYHEIARAVDSPWRYL